MIAPMPTGYYRDVLIDSRGRIQWDNGWRPNLVVQSCNVLLAALMKRHEGMTGILYWAIGEGQAGWDASLPSPRVTDSRLTQEFARQELALSQMVYLDDENAPIDTPSNRLEIAAEFRGEDYVSNGQQPLREFGLFGGDATEAPDTGVMIDYVIHPRIDLTPGMTLNRQLRLTFTDGRIQPADRAGLGLALPIISIDGVGDEYASDLNAQGIDSILALSEVDASRPVGNIPQIKLIEFRAKARLLRNLRIYLTPFAPLADLDISRILRERPEDLAGAMDTPDVTAETVSRLQEELAMLQVALNDLQLQQITLGDLMASQSLGSARDG